MPAHVLTFIIIVTMDFSALYYKMTLKILCMLKLVHMLVQFFFV